MTQSCNIQSRLNWFIVRTQLGVVRVTRTAGDIGSRQEKSQPVITP